MVEAGVFFPDVGRLESPPLGVLFAGTGRSRFDLGESVGLPLTVWLLCSFCVVTAVFGSACSRTRGFRA